MSRLRGFFRTPGWTTTVVLTLALGIGLTTAVFTVADALLLRRLPVRDQDRIVVVSGTADWPLDVDGARLFAQRTRALSQVAWFHYAGAYPVSIVEGDRISRLRRSLVSGSFFAVLGAHPMLGRALQPSDDVPGAAPVAVLSYQTWQQRFAGNPRVLGAKLQTYQDSIGYTIVGVMPRGLEFPLGADFWAPIITSGQVNVVGRLAPSARLANARDEMTAFFQRADAPLAERDIKGVARTLPDLVVGDVRPALFAFVAACGVLLLITCVNVANLLLVRGVTRVQEMNVRHALGADRRRLIMDLLSENVLLAAAGGIVGVAVAIIAVRSFIALAPPDLPRLGEIQLNASALAGAIGITAVATLLFALAPAFATSRLAVRHGPSRRSRRTGEALAAGQIALALIVLSAAGLIARSLVNLERAKLAFDPSHLLTGELTMRAGTTDQRTVIERLSTDLRAIPGVRGVSPVVAAPFAGTAGWDGRMMAEGQSNEDMARNPLLNLEVISPDYFTTLGVSLLRGRAFTDGDRDGTLPVVMLSESAARDLWPHSEAIGRRVSMGPDTPTWFTVVGIVPDTRYRDLRTARPSIYFPLDQSPFPFTPWNLAIRLSGPPADIVPVIRQVIAQRASGVALGSAQPFATMLDRPLAQPRLNALLLSVFALAALALAVVGLFGVMAAMVRQRTHELRVRMALGATAGNLRGMIMRRGLAIALSGCACGLIASLLADRLVGAMLYNVGTADPLTLGLVVGSLLGAAALAIAVPARTSTRVDATMTLRP